MAGSAMRARQRRSTSGLVVEVDKGWPSSAKGGLRNLRTASDRLNDGVTVVSADDALNIGCSMRGEDDEHAGVSPDVQVRIER